MPVVVDPLPASEVITLADVESDLALASLLLGILPPRTRGSHRSLPLSELRALLSVPVWLIESRCVCE